MSMVPDRSVPGPVKKSPRPPGRPGRVPAGCPSHSKGKRGPFRHFTEFPRFVFVEIPPALVRPQPNASESARPAAGKSKISQFWAQGTRSEPRRFRRRRSRWDGRKISWMAFSRLHERARFRSRFPENGVKKIRFHPWYGTLTPWDL